MSRRQPRPHIAFHVLHLDCPDGHRVGDVYLQRPGAGESPFMVGHPLERLDGPNGETKILARCPVCRRTGSTAAPQVRWARIEAELLDMEATGAAQRTMTPR